MSVRNNRGHYTAEMIRGGMRDQYAVMRSYGMVVVELRHDGVGQRPWLVSCEIRKGDAVSVTDIAFSTLDEARREYRRLVRKHP